MVLEAWPRAKRSQLSSAAKLAQARDPESRFELHVWVAFAWKRSVAPLSFDRPESNEHADGRAGRRDNWRHAN